jgi:hypothetical protein
MSGGSTKRGAISGYQGCVGQFRITKSPETFMQLKGGKQKNFRFSHETEKASIYIASGSGL